MSRGRQSLPMQLRIRRKFIALLPARALLAMAAFAAQHNAAVLRAQPTQQSLRLTIGADGALRGLRDVPVGLERLRSAGPLCTAIVGGREFPSIAMRSAGEPMQLGFEQAGLSVTLRVDVRPDFLILRLEQLSDSIESLRLLDLKLAAPEQVLAKRIFVYRGRCLGVLVDSPESELTVDAQGRDARVTLHRKLPTPAPQQLAGRQVALFACETARMNEVLAEVEAALKIPIGVRSKLDVANRRSYLFATEYDAAALPRLAQHARDGGFGSLLLLEDEWSTLAQGGKSRRFPGGIEQLRDALESVRAAGLRVGMHLKTTVIPKSHALVAPRPDPRLATHATLTLARPVGQADDFLQTPEPPTDWPRVPGKRDVRVGDEIISYTDLSLSPPFGFLGCQRGQYGTQAAPHAAGARLDGLRTDFVGSLYVLDPATRLLDEHAALLARTYQHAGFDWLYFDHAEDTPPPLWYTVSRGQLALLDQLQRRPAVVQASTETMFGWHLTTRSGQRDYFKLSMNVKDEIDDALATSVPRARSELMSAEIGWFPLRLPTQRLPGTSIDEIEYLYVKALAADAAVSLQASAAIFDALPHRGAMLAIMRTLEQLRLEGYFTREQRAQLAAPRSDHLLIKDDQNRYHLPRAREIPFVAGTSLDVRAFLAEPVGALRVISLWNVGPPQWLELAIPADEIELSDYLGRKPRVEARPGGLTRIAVETRLYARVRGDWEPWWVFRQARVAPLN